MNVLVMGYRKGICQALEKFHVNYTIWNPKKVKTQRKAFQIIEREYPKSHEELLSELPGDREFTHVISGAEDSVYPASLARRWLGTRSNLLSVAVKCTDKLKMKLYLKDKEIPMTPFLSKKEYVNPDKAIKELGKPIVLKPRKSSGGRGLKIIEDESEIDEVISNRVLLEKIIEGTEGSVESLIDGNEIIFTNITQYKKLGKCNYVPAHYTKKHKSEILDLNHSVIKALKIKWGISHLEFYNTKEGLLFGEIALRPPGGYIMETLEQVYGSNFWELLVKIELKLGGIEVPKQIKYGASYILYPETTGKVLEIIGEKEVKALKSVIKFKVKAKVGQTIPERAGVGEDFGYCIFAHENKKQLTEDISAFEKIFEIKVEK